MDKTRNVIFKRLQKVGTKIIFSVKVDFDNLNTEIVQIVLGPVG